uniref:Reverse transcriptase Ty1/copia-type domain-containing protein n=1 Tax=Chenopodium quinoa TaxID=63459 RepID=A0A803N3U2_CHEQI
MTTHSKHGIVNPNPKYHDQDLHTCTSISPIPKNPVHVVYDHNWKNALQEEFDALIDNGTWDLVPRPPNVNIICSLRIFWHKTKSDGSFERHKARLVGDGKTQREGIDCDKSFSLVVKPATIRVVLSIALSKSWPIINWMLKMHSYMSFYGLKRFADFVATIVFAHSKSDNSLFIYRHDNSTAYILLYVDDIVLIASLNSLRQHIISQISSEFAMKDLGKLSYFFGYCCY